jgi:hemoglobin/transferrin/lactoferrin receptor protein
LNGQDSILFQGEMSQVQAIQNAAFATVYGLQLGLEYKLPAGFKFSSDINLQKGQEELDNGNRSPSRHAPPAYGISRLTYKTERLQMQVYLAWQAQRSFEDLAAEEQGKDEIYAKDANGNNYAPGWYTLNLKALYEWSPNLKISAGLENITDQRYRPYSSGISGAGRNFILALNAYF